MAREQSKSSTHSRSSSRVKWKVNFPPIHTGQTDLNDWIIEGRKQGRKRFPVACGRRFGKSHYASIYIANAALKGQECAVFVPKLKTSAEMVQTIADYLLPVTVSHNRSNGVLRTNKGGRVDFWSLVDVNAGRSRGYHKILIDEAAFTEPSALDTWDRAIKPTLLDYDGEALVVSSTNGLSDENFFYRLCHDPALGFVNPDQGFSFFHAPSAANPRLSRETLAEFERNNAPLVWRQEYLAEFVNWSGFAFFALDKALDNGNPVESPKHCDIVFATADTAVKTGKQHDGTGVIYWALTKFPEPRLIALDWELFQIEGSLLEHKFPEIFARLSDLAVQCGARMGSAGVWIEDKQSGQMLIPQLERRGLAVHAIDTKLTSFGKDERAVSVSGYCHRGLVKVARQAYDRIERFHDRTQNHFLSQIFSFRIGDKTAGRSDDLLDCWTYGVSIALGDNTGW